MKSRSADILMIVRDLKIDSETNFPIHNSNQAHNIPIKDSDNEFEKEIHISIGENNSELDFAQRRFLEICEDDGGSDLIDVYGSPKSLVLKHLTENSLKLIIGDTSNDEFADLNLEEGIRNNCIEFRPPKVPSFQIYRKDVLPVILENEENKIISRNPVLMRKKNKSEDTGFLENIAKDMRIRRGELYTLPNNSLGSFRSFNFGRGDEGTSKVKEKEKVIAIIKGQTHKRNKSTLLGN